MECIIRFVFDKAGVNVSENCIHMLGINISKTDYSEDVVIHILSEPYKLIISNHVRFIHLYTST